MRSVAAIVAGYLIFALAGVLLFQLTGQAPHRPASVAFMLGSTLYGIGFAALGGWVAARFARTRRRLHAGLVAALIALGATVSLLTTAGAGAHWSPLTALVCMAPAAWLGGYWQARRGAGASPSPE